MESQRRLISIVFSDIKGYTSLMHEDEGKALGTVERYENTIKSAAVKFQGEIINFMGDGALIIFNNSVDAIDFGIHIQKEFTQGTPIPHRVGIHTGEGTIRNNKIYGDSVNIASRIESISVPGALLISDATYQLIKNQNKYDPVLIGKYRFKNISEPMKVYAMRNGGLIIPKKKEIKKNAGASSKFIYYLIGCLVLGLLATLFLNKDFFQKDTKSASFSYKYPKGKSYFIGIGIDKYQNWNQLNNAVNDVKGIAKTFKNHLGFEELVPLITNEYATKESINKTFQNNIPALLNPEDRLIVFFAGHGYTKKIDTDSDSVDVGYLVPHNGESQDFSNPKNYINIDSFLVKIGNLPPENITVILDACESGFALSDQIQAQNGASDTENNLTRLVITSADKYETASDEGPIENHSLFTGKLIEAIENGTIQTEDNFFDVNRLGSYLVKAVSNYSEQSPRVGPFYNHSDDEMLLYLQSSDSKIDFESATEIKGENDSLETIAVIPFENLSNDSEFQNYAKYLESSLFQFLSEVHTIQPKFRTITPRSIKSLTRGASNVAYSSYSSIGADIILSGQLFKLNDDQLIIKPTILNGAGKILGVFQDIIVEDQDMRQAAFLLKQRLKTFFLQKDELTKLTINVPDYRAFLLHEEATASIRKDHNKVRDLASQAIEIDSNYLDAHLTYLYSYLDFERNYEMAEDYALYLKRKFRDVDLTNYQRQRLSISIGEAKRNYSEIFKSYNALLDQHPKDHSTIGNTIVYAYNANHLTECKQLIDQYRPSEYFEKRKGMFDNIYIESLWNQDSISKAHSYILKNDDNKPGYYEYNLGLSYAVQNDIESLDNFMNEQYSIVIEANKSYAYSLSNGIGKILLTHKNQKQADKYFDLAYEAIDESTHFHRTLSILNLKQNYTEVINKVKTKNIKFSDKSSTNFYSGIELLKAYAALGNAQYEDHLSQLQKYYGKENPHLLHYGIAQAEALRNNITQAMEHINIAYSKGREYRFPRYKYDPYFILLSDENQFIDFNRDKSI